MSTTVQVSAKDLPKYIGHRVVGHGRMKKAAVVQPGGDIVVAEFGEGFGRAEAVFQPNEIVTVEVDE